VQQSYKEKSFPVIIEKCFHSGDISRLKELQYFCCGELPFHYIYDLATWHFYADLISKNNTVVDVLYKVIVNSEGVLL